MKKNVASQVVGAQMITASDGSAFTGSVTVYVTTDGGTQALGGTGSGACTHEGNGFHSYVPTQSETNGDHIAFTFIGTGAIPATVQAYTTFPQTGDSYARLGAPAGASVSADIATVDTVVDGIQTDLSNGTDGLGAIKADTAAILTDTAEIGVAGAGLTNINLPDQTMNITGNITGNLSGSVGSVTGAVGSVTGAVGSVTSAVTIDATSVDLIWDETLTAHVTADSAAVAVKDILADTNELQTDDVPGTLATLATSAALATVDANVDAILVDTDATIPGLISGLNDPTAAAIADAVWDETLTAHVTADSAAVHLKDVLADTAVIGAAGAGLTAIPWNASWDAEVQSECADALTAYDPPTKAELDSGLAGLNDLDAAGVAGAVWNAATATYGSAGSYGLVVETNLDAPVSGATAPTAAAVADAVWDEALAGHLGAGSTGEALNAAGAAGDPWTTALPGAYSAGQAGYIVGTNLDAPISTVDTVVDGIQTDLSNGTDGLGAIKAAVDAIPTSNPTAAAIADAVLDEALSGHVIAGSLGKAVADIESDATAILTDTGTTIPAQISGLNDISSADVTAAVPTATENADALLNRDMSAVSDTNARSPLNALRFIRNKYSIAGSTLTVTKEDDTTSAWTATLTTDAAAEPVTGSDPA